MFVILRFIDFVEIQLKFSPISPPQIKTPIRMSDVIRPKRQTFEEWLQGPKSSDKLHVQPIKPEPLNMAEVVTEIKEEEDDNSSTHMDSLERSITPIDDGEEIDVPQIPSNQFGLLKKPAAWALKNFCLSNIKYTHIY